MEETLDHEHHHSDHAHNHGSKSMAVSATLHCLTGCAIGELLGMVIGLAIGLGMWQTVGLSITLAFVFGYALSALPLLRNNVPLGQALKLVLVADTLSIASMEVAENLIMVAIPGAMDSGLVNPLFWVSMSFAFLVGFAVAYPVNRHLLKRNLGHAITHAAAGHKSMNNKPLALSLSAFMLVGFLVSTVLS